MAGTAHAQWCAAQIARLIQDTASKNVGKDADVAT
jgi:hypothetical protein